MPAFLLKDIRFEDLYGGFKTLPKGLIVKVDDFDEGLIVIPEGPLEYIVRVETNDYRRLSEMN